MQTVGTWLLNEDECTLTQGETTRQLSPRSMSVLVALVEKCGQLIASQELQDRFWPNSYSAEHGLHKAISEIRTAFGDDPKSPRYVKTFARRGYSFICQDDVLGNPDRTHSQVGGHRDRAPVPPSASVAVLPFVNISGDPGNEYFSDGLTEELLNVLSNIKELKVAARTSSFHFKGRTGDIAEIARQLGVAAILEGSVRQSSTRIRITAQLISAADGYHLWSETFDRVLDDIFAVQDEIASAVAKSLEVKLLGDRDDRLAVGGTNNNEAFKAYLLGEHHRHRGDIEEPVRSAIKAYEKALALDPDYAKAHVGLARSWVQMAANSFCTYEEGIGHVEEAIDKAIVLAPDLADAYLAQSYLLAYLKQDLVAAQEAISKAIQLSPGNAEIMMEYARVRCYHGHADEAIAAAQRAVNLDPVSLYANHFLGHILYFSRHYDEAISVLRRVLEMDPQYPKPHYFIAMSLFWQGHVEAAWEEIQQEALDWMRWAASSVILQRLGRIDEAEAEFANISEDEQQECAAIQRADTYVQWGNIDMAYMNLELSFKHGDPGLAQLYVDPFLDPIRDDPRYIEMVRRLRFDLPDG
ncbi:MAG: winged helix-turn-helix domain-containing protein [Gammaproteobacteria bacterium]